MIFTSLGTIRNGLYYGQSPKPYIYVDENNKMGSKVTRSQFEQNSITTIESLTLFAIGETILFVNGARTVGVIYYVDNNIAKIRRATQAEITTYTTTAPLVMRSEITGTYYKNASYAIVVDTAVKLVPAASAGNQVDLFWELAPAIDSASSEDLTKAVNEITQLADNVKSVFVSR